MAVKNDAGNINVQVIMDDLHSVIDKRVKGIAQKLIRTLQLNNPVDRSRYADEWYSYLHWEVALGTYTYTALSGSIGKGVSGDVGGVGIGLRTGTTFLKTQSQGDSIEQFDSKKHRSLVVFNPSPYMARLNADPAWSPQAEPGWIERCIDEVTAEAGL